MNTRRIFLCGLFAATVSLSALQSTRATANEDYRKDDRNGSIGAIYTASNATADNQM
jgi:hypothetical protein